LTGSVTAHPTTPWASSNTAVATVNSAGVVTGVAAGTTNITYMNSLGCTVTASFTVTAGPAVNAGLDVNICAGTPTQLNATLSNISNPTLSSVLTAINANNAALIASIPSPSGFNMDNGVNSNNINDGCGDMYDTGNFLNTNLAANINYSDNLVISSGSFGTGGQYFTRYLGPGGCQAAPATIFYMGADISGLTSVSITGNLGADGTGTQDLTTFTVSANGVVYNCYLKRVYNAFDPSVNQIFLIPQPTSATQAMGATTDNNLHSINGLSGVTRIYYMLYAGANGAFINNTQATAIAQTFANIIPSPVSFSWSPATGLSSTTITNPVATPSSTITYTLTATSGG
jgi:hypothetical protein